MHRNLWLAFALAALFALGSCTSSSNITPTPTPPLTVKAPSIVVDWNEAMLAAIRAAAPRPTVRAHSMFMASAAMYDAWAMYDAKATPVAIDATLRRPAVEQTE